MKSDEKAELAHIYDDCRSSYLNKLYFSGKLSVARKLALTLEVLLAVGTVTSLASLKLLEDNKVVQDSIPEPIRKYFFTIAITVAGLAAIIAVVKPTAQLDKRIENLSKVVSGYNELFQKFKRICESVKIHQGLLPEMRFLVNDLQGRLDQLEIIDDSHPSSRHLEKLMLKVDMALPQDHFYMPMDDCKHEPAQNASPTKALPGG